MPKLLENIVGEIFPTNKYGLAEVVKYCGSKEVTIRFVNTNSTKVVSLGHLRKGLVQDNFAKSCYGVGYIGETSTSQDGKHKPSYVLWKDMLKRCYQTEYQESHLCYIGCEVSDEFKCFANFEIWCDQQQGFDEKGFRLDKDILVKGNKTYSRTTCCFVPQEVNGLFIRQVRRRGDYPLGVSLAKDTGKFKARISCESVCKHLSVHDTPEEAFQAYKQAKESYIKEVAEKWRKNIDPRVYEALMNWTVEIND